jgi:hypothetical protein
LILYLELKKFFQKSLKKVLTKGKVNDIIARHSAKRQGGKKETEPLGIKV